MHFFIAYFLGENSKFGIETSHAPRDQFINKANHFKLVANNILVAGPITNFYGLLLN